MRRGVVTAWVFALALMLGLGRATQGHAADWMSIGSSQRGDQFELDVTSLKMRGEMVDAWTRAKLVTPGRDAFSNKPYFTMATEQLQDCGRQLSATIGYVYYDDQGATTSSYDVPDTNWRFTSTAPSSTGEQFRVRICDLARAKGLLGGAAPTPAATPQPGRPTASLKVGPNSAETWTPVAVDAREGSQISVFEDAIYTVKEGGLLFFFQKVVRPKPASLGPDKAYVSAYSMMFADCGATAYGLGSTDFYGADGQLVDTIRVDDPKKVEMKRAAPDSLMAIVVRAVCKPGLAKPIPPPSEQHADGGDPAADDEVETGTAWLGPKGYLITANHVIDGADHLELMQGGRTVGAAEVVLADPANDVAVLKPTFKDGPHPAIGMSLQPAILGERIFTMGFPAPDAMGVSLKMTAGEISSLTGQDAATQRLDDARMMQVSIPVQSGNSGGPVLADDGRAVGIVLSRLERIAENETAQNVNYALKIAYVRALLAELPDIGGYRPVRVEPSRAAAVADLQGAVFLIVASKDAPAH
jgi:S1-C subfamily serine protease